MLLKFEIKINSNFKENWHKELRCEYPYNKIYLKLDFKFMGFFRTFCTTFCFMPATRCMTPKQQNKKHFKNNHWKQVANKNKTIYRQKVDSTTFVAASGYVAIVSGRRYLFTCGLAPLWSFGSNVFPAAATFACVHHQSNQCNFKTKDANLIYCDCDNHMGHLKIDGLLGPKGPLFIRKEGNVQGNCFGWHISR